jgi:1-acyl-sn-glycerol-3-phosphate acyltransferase
VPVLYIGNHRSFFDVPLTYPRCPIRTGYIAKKEMEKVPLLSTWMKRLHCLFLDRNDLKQGLKTILTAIEKVKSGISICIFPEGTRNKNEDELDMLHSMRAASKLPQRQTVRSSRWRSAAPLISGKTIFQELRKPTLSWNMANQST